MNNQSSKIEVTVIYMACSQTVGANLCQRHNLYRIVIENLDYEAYLNTTAIFEKRLLLHASRLVYSIVIYSIIIVVLVASYH